MRLLGCMFRYCRIRQVDLLLFLAFGKAGLGVPIAWKPSARRGLVVPLFDCRGVQPSSLSLGRASSKRGFAEPFNGGVVHMARTWHEER